MLSPEEMALIDFKTHPRAKKLKLSASSARGFILTAPSSVSIESCKQFLDENAEWIRKHINIVEKKQAEKAFQFETKYETFFRDLELIPTELTEIKSRVSEQKIKIYINPNEISKKKSQNEIKKIIIEVLRKEAKLYLPHRIEELAKPHNLKFIKLTIKDMKSQWGSCSYCNNINLSLHLMRLPRKLIDYVIMHELTHTIEKNHSNRFWDKLESFLPGAKNLDKELKNYHPEILL